MSVVPRLTVGMACYDDFDGVWFTVTALRMYHAEVLPEIEIVVVDNHPGSADAAAVREFLQHWTNVRYVPYRDKVGTAAPRDEVFRQARGTAVLCIDSHVLIVPGALARLLGYLDEHPEGDDLLQGPLVYDDLQTYSSHFDDVWREQMWGVWGTDARAASPDSPPFEIPAQGLGLFCCRKSAWPGFHPDFRGFGGEEFYIHEKFRRLGRKTLCLPFLRWVHRFARPRGVPYPLLAQQKFRNYVLGLRELELPLEPAIELFAAQLSPEVMRRIIADPRREIGEANGVRTKAPRASPWARRLKRLIYGH